MADEQNSNPEQMGDETSLLKEQMRRQEEFLKTAYALNKRTSRYLMTIGVVVVAALVVHLVLYWSRPTSLPSKAAVSTSSEPLPQPTQTVVPATSAPQQVQISHPGSLRQGLIGEWLFNGNAADTSGNGHHGIPNGTKIGMDRFGKPASSAYFDGQSNIVIPYRTLLLSKEYTISLWMVLTREDQEFLFSQYKHDSGGKHGRFKLYHAGARLTFTVSPDGTLDDDLLSRVIDMGAWHFAAVVFSESQGSVTLYTDGYPPTKTTIAYSPAPETCDYTIGGHRLAPLHGGQSFYFKGFIDDLRIYNRVLSDKEIQSLYHEGGWDMQRQRQ